MTTDSVDADALAFFNALSGILDIQLSESPERISERLENLAAPPTAQLVGLSFGVEVDEDDEDENGDFRPLTDAEWSRVVLRAPSIRMRSNKKVVQHRAPDGATFTVRDLVAAVEETERRTRGGTEWFGGIDVHHIFFEGMHEEDGTWWLHWGS